MLNFKTLFFLFIIYSFIGWCIEVINSLISQKKFINRGFLIGPYCPIYGFGCVLITLLIKDTGDFATLFLKSVLICSILEYFTSYIMEKLFKYRWWDYSKRKFNINGRVCLETMVPFALGACIVIKFTNPIIFKLLSFMNNTLSTILFILMLILIVIDSIISIILVKNIKGIEKNTITDSTEQLKDKIKEMIQKNKNFYKRIFESFPGLKSTSKKRWLILNLWYSYNRKEHIWKKIFSGLLYQY